VGIEEIKVIAQGVPQTVRAPCAGINSNAKGFVNKQGEIS
jgi:hypothetical protein